MTDERGAAGWPWVRLLRPQQWIKNVLVLAAPAAAGVLDEGEYLGRALVVGVAFCLAASGTYCLNDVADAEADRAHPAKRRRPVAAGEISPAGARGLGIVLLVLAVSVGAATGSWEASAVTATYIALTTAYTIWFKHVPVLDIGLVTSFFVIRAVAGVVGTDIPLSDWYLIVASFGALFLVAGKRATELRLADAPDHRAALAGYTPGFLRYAQSVASGVALLAYCLWAFEKANLADSSVPWFQLSIVPFVVLFMRYALILETEERRGPEEILLEDRQLQVVGFVWAALFACGVYLGHAPPLTG
ncbi:MAG: decaprenyl-phosphate phosphoribosyltransferase [Acidimicrobiales bacterium]